MKSFYMQKHYIMVSYNCEALRRVIKRINCDDNNKVKMDLVWFGSTTYKPL